jgi:hypothetical protein
MVTNHKMIENSMGNRGSKSVLVSSTVKEQRVDGSYLKTKNKPKTNKTFFFKFKMYSNGLRK